MTNKAEKKKITFEEYCILKGLLALGLEHYELAIMRIAPTMAAIVGEKAEDANSRYPYFGHVSDAIYSHYTVEEMLAKLDIAIPAAPNSKSAA